MTHDRSWMQHRICDTGGGVTDEFSMKLEEFLDFAYLHKDFVDGDKIRCPCFSCMNIFWKPKNEVRMHLLRKGFTSNYFRWTHHGESFIPRAGSSSISAEIENRTQQYHCRNIVLDAMGVEYDPCDESSTQDVWMEEEPSGNAIDFYQLLKDAEEPLYNGQKMHTKLSAVTQLLDFKSETGCSEKGFNKLLKLIKEFLPDDNQLPCSFYEVKKMVRQLGLGYEKIDACDNDCVLYWSENKSSKHCPVCGLSRYKLITNDGKGIPWKVLRYFPIGPRLQRLYMSSKTSAHMRWHKMYNKVEGELRHPSDGEAWKYFDSTFPSFSTEPRNVRLGLATDGFNPFGHSGMPYSTWPVILVPYNLPPWMCMKFPYMFLSLLIPGPKSPGKDIDVYLRPLIDELKMLWETGVPTYDASLKQNFQMKAAVMWTINDFPAYGMMEGWSTHGKLACPVCKDSNAGFTLRNGGKPCFFGCHRRFLPDNHIFRKQGEKFDNTKEKRNQPTRMSGQEVKEWLDDMQVPPYGKYFKDQKIDGFGKSHNWTKRSIFFELPYWSSQLLRHNLDVMHIEKNVFENVFNTVMSVKGKSKDNLKARKDLEELKIRPELHPLISANGKKATLPSACFALNKQQIKLVCEWVKQLKLPDGYASNISRCCNLSDCRFYGLKSHDCHVFMEKLLPVAFRDLLPKPVVEALVELCHFFRDICSTVLRQSDLDVLQANIVETICKLEKIFPPSFFDAMEHLPIHLCYEAKVGGPVQYRWMYPFERYMGRLKRKVHNKARVEGSIAEAYIIEELVNFCSLYFDDHIETRHNRTMRNDDQDYLSNSNQLSVFKQTGSSIGACSTRPLTDAEHSAATLYTLMNCDEVEPFIIEFDDQVLASNPNISDQVLENFRNTNFISWFQKRVLDDNAVDTRLKCLARGPKKMADTYKAYKINGFRFHIASLESSRQTQSSGVLVKGTCYNDAGSDFYGRLVDVVELHYLGDGNRVTLFKCDWYDITRGIRVDRNGIIQINTKSRLSTNEPFVLSTQASQIFYAKSVAKKDSEWSTVIKFKARSWYDLPADDDSSANISIGTDETYQEYETPVVSRNEILTALDDVSLLVATEPGEEVDLEMGEHLGMTTLEEEESEEESEEEQFEDATEFEEEEFEFSDCD